MQQSTFCWMWCHLRLGATSLRAGYGRNTPASKKTFWTTTFWLIDNLYNIIYFSNISIRIVLLLINWFEIHQNLHMSEIPLFVLNYPVIPFILICLFKVWVSKHYQKASRFTDYVGGESSWGVQWGWGNKLDRNNLF